MLTNKNKRVSVIHKRHLTAGVVASMLLAGCGGDDGDGGGTPPPTPGTPVAQTSNLTGSVKDVTVEMHEGTNMAAAPSPDGKQIVFSAQGALWVIPIGGGGATRITPWTMEPTAPVWSPDGKLIAFQNYTQEGNYHIWTIEPNGANAREVTTGFFDDREPAWKPDGTALVFSSDRSNDGQYKIWTASLSGGLTQVTSGPGAESNPVFSPDGQKIALVDSNTLYSVPATGGARTAIGPGITPSYTPDGTALVYQTPERVLNVRGSLVSGSEDLFPFPVRWLPDGRFVYTSDGKIRIRDAAGASAGDVAFSANLTVRRPVFNKRSRTISSTARARSRSPASARPRSHPTARASSSWRSTTSGS